jgi:glycerol-3-phosphate acyltransferase PlsX
MMFRIGLDMMGGDFAPDEAVKGIQTYLNAFPEHVQIVCFGEQNAVLASCKQNNLDASLLELVHTTQVIEMNEHPTRALKEKSDSSIAVGFQFLAEGKIDAFISAGNTGAMMVGSLFSIKTIDGIIRPTIGAYIPREDGTLGLLLDVGLNADCKPEQLNQFALLGSLYVEQVMGTKNPKVGLINLGEEEGKGNLLTQSAYALLKSNEKINFSGNIEGRDILLNKADVMVCEGFTGNVVLKMAESVYDIVKRRQINDDHFNRFDFEMYGGVPVLGVSKPVIIGHGISHQLAFKNMIVNAVKMLETGLIDNIKAHFLQEVQ